MDITKLLEKNQKWAAEKLNVDKDYFANLAQGQKPSILFIACVDSRTSPELILNMELGEILVQRNMANQVLVEDASMQALLEFSLTTLEIAHIIVCGHYGCGGIELALSHKDLPEQSPLRPWLNGLIQLSQKHQSKWEALDFATQAQRMVAWNVKQQCLNLSNIPIVASALQDGKVDIHGWIFDIPNACIIDMSEGMSS